MLEANPQLTLWATVCRCSAPGNGEGLPGKAEEPQRGVSRQPGASPLGPENETKASPERADQDRGRVWKGLGRPFRARVNVGAWTQGVALGLLGVPRWGVQSWHLETGEWELPPQYL